MSASKDVSVTFEDDSGREWDITGRVTGGDPEVPTAWAGPGEPADHGELVDVTVRYLGGDRQLEDVFVSADVRQDIEDKLWEAAAEE